jgi:hypothetical protein
MRQITSEIIEAFQSGTPLRKSNSFTDGKALYLFDNLIAEHRAEGLYITNAGWFSKTTKDRLNGLRGVDIRVSKGKWFLNGNEWDGTWTKVNTSTPPTVDEEAAGNIWDMSKSWVSTDGMRGYEQPAYAVCGANDTGMWDDSPCRSDIAEAELTAVKKALSKAKIQTKLMTCESSNVFCVHHYLIVRPKDIQKARDIVSSHVETVQTNLLYTCK